MVRNLLFIFSLLLLFSCTEKENSDPYVRVDTGGIYRPVSVYLNGDVLPDSVNLGEWVTASSPIIMTLTIRNNTNFPVTNIDFSFPGQTNNVYNFATGAEDDGKFPGFGGTCSTRLDAHKTCEIVLQFYTAKSGTYIQEGFLTYKNLVESDSRTITFSVVAGLPASLIFDDGSSRKFIFGNEIGVTKKPVVERADRIEFHRKLTLSNMGELAAREIAIEKIFLCSSAYEANTTCPTEYQDPWRLEHNCPSELAPLQSCEMDMYFIPLNQDPETGFDPVLEELNYKGDIKISYKRTPTGGDTSLTGRFETNSTTIQANFMSSKTGIDYGDNVISGNFKLDMFNVRNSGYREGELRKVIFRKIEGSPVNPAKELVECRVNAENTGVSCYDLDGTDKLSLQDFPFVVSDRNGCLSNGIAEEDKVLLDIEESCVFDLRFQPSTSYIQPYEFHYNLSVEYDARWKGLETIKEAYLFEVSALSIQPAKVELFKVEFDGVEKEISTGLEVLGIDNQVTLGRLALLSPGYESWRKVTLTYRNVGGVPVSFLKSFVGHEAGHAGAPVTEIPKSSDVASGITVGPYATKYYRQMMIDMNNCGSGGAIAPDPDRTGIIPTAFCQVTFLFSPTGMSTNAEEDASMFDILESNPKLRVLSFNYHDGSYYSDTNFTNIPDLQTSNLAALKKSSLGLTASLVKSGFLQSYYTGGNIGAVTRGNIGHRNFIFRNIGTGPIPYLPFKGSFIPHENNLDYDMGVRRMIVTNPGAYGADHDCNNVFDFEWSATDTVETILPRVAGKVVLQKMESCVLRLQAKEALQFYSSTVGGFHGLLGLPSDIDFNNTIQNYQLRESTVTRTINLSYYDGDAEGQESSSDEIRREFGELVETGVPGSHLKQTINFQARFQEHIRLVVGNPIPYQSAVIYVPERTYPTYNYQNNTGVQVTKTGITVPSTFYAYENRQTTVPTSCDTDSFLFPSCFSPQYVSTRLGDTSNYDYVIHAGTFPVNKTIPIQFNVLNAGFHAGRLKKETESFVGDKFNLIANYTDGMVMSRSTMLTAYGVISGGYPVQINFMSSEEGAFEAVYRISYLNGSAEAPEESHLRVKIIAEAKEEFPKLSFETHDYDVTPIPGSAPTEALGPSNGVIEAGLNHRSSLVNSVVEAVKVKNRTTEAAYAKKRIIIRNTSSVEPMTNIKYMFKDTAIGITDSTRISWASGANLSAKVSQENCRAKTSLAPLDWCYIDIWYQPLETDIDSSFILTVSYGTNLAVNQFIQENLTIELIPKMPSVIRVRNLEEQNIAYRKRGEGGTVYSGKAFVNPIGNLLYNAVDKTFEFTHILQNFSEDTKASLLKQYELHRGLGNTNYGPSDISPSEFVGGFVTIYSRSDMIVRANSICLFGGSDLSSVPNEERGFYEATSGGECQIRVTFSPGINSIGRQYLFSSVEDVSDIYIPLKYYNNKRASFDEFIITFTGKIYPDRSSVPDVAGQYYDVEALSNGNIEFSWLPFTPSNNTLGDIVGYRVYYSKYSDDFGDEFVMLNSNADYVDIRNGTTSAAVTVANEASIYYIYVAAIRHNPSYTRNIFPNLASGEYLSHSGIKVTKFVIPPNDLYFAYEQNMLIAYERLGDGYIRCNSEACSKPRYTYDNAILACQALSPVSISHQGLMIEKRFDLINEKAWESISSDFVMSSSHSDAHLAPHWLKTGLVYDIDAIFSSVPGFDSVQSSQTFEDPYRLHYRRSNPEHCSTYGTCLVPKVAGSLAVNDFGYISYIGPGFMIPHARCYVPLD